MFNKHQSLEGGGSRYNLKSKFREYKWQDRKSRWRAFPGANDNCHIELWGDP